MKKNISFETVYLDIVKDVIYSPVVVGRYRGSEFKEILDSRMHELQQNSLLLIDFRKANPLDYIFCQYAFGPILKTLQENSNDFKFLLFQMYEHHKSCFFRGVLKHIDKDLPRTKDAFVEANMFTMIQDGESNKIEYVSKLSNVEKEILDLIDCHLSISGRDIIEEKKSIPFESVGDALRSLNDKGFIVHIKNDDDHYHSIYNYIKQQNHE